MPLNPAKPNKKVNVQSTSIVQMKRGRGRPRKNPLVTTQQMDSDEEVLITNASKGKLHAMFDRVEKEANRNSINQERMIRAALLAVLAREHVALVGPWGCNKTGTINTMLYLLGVEKDDTFSITLDKNTPPEALLGMYSVKELKNDRYVRKLEGKIACAAYAFIGEVFRGNGSVRASLHTVLNERYIDNDGKHVPCPLRTAFLDSNSYPVREEDMPFYDRILFRYDVNYLPTGTTGAFTKMLALKPLNRAKVKPLLSLDHIDEAVEQVAEIKIPVVIFDLIADLRAKCAADGITLSDRRWKKSLKALQASAWLRADSEVTIADFAAFQHVLWDTPDQCAKVTKILSQYSPAKMQSSDEALITQAQGLFAKANQFQSDSIEFSDAYSTLSDIAARIVDPAQSQKVNDMVTHMESLMSTGFSV